MKRDWTQAFQIAAVYVGTVVGAGFATGKEIVEFFSRFGFFGLISILMSGYLFISLGSKLMRMAALIDAKSYQEFNEYLFGKWPGRVINVFMLFMLLGVSAVMLSGAGAIFRGTVKSAQSSRCFPDNFFILFSHASWNKRSFCCQHVCCSCNDHIQHNFNVLFHSNAQLPQSIIIYSSFRRWLEKCDCTIFICGIESGACTSRFSTDCNRGKG